MTEETETLVMEILKKIQHELSLVRQDVSDLKLRNASIENHLASLHLDMVQMGARIDTLSRRIERVETRLGMADA